MDIDIRTRGLRIDDNTRVLVNLRVGHALDRVQVHVSRVMVYLADENGPRGGVDKTCRIVVDLRGCPTVVVEARNAHLRELIDEATERCGQAVRRSVDRLREARIRNHPAVAG